MRGSRSGRASSEEKSGPNFPGHFGSQHGNFRTQPDDAFLNRAEPILFSTDRRSRIPTRGGGFEWRDHVARPHQAAQNTEKLFKLSFDPFGFDALAARSARGRSGRGLERSRRRFEIS